MNSLFRASSRPREAPQRHKLPYGLPKWSKGHWSHSEFDSGFTLLQAQAASGGTLHFSAAVTLSASTSLELEVVRSRDAARDRTTTSDSVSLAASRYLAAPSGPGTPSTEGPSAAASAAHSPDHCDAFSAVGATHSPQSALALPGPVPASRESNGRSSSSGVSRGLLSPVARVAQQF